MQWKTVFSKGTLHKARNYYRIAIIHSTARTARWLGYGPVNGSLPGMVKFYFKATGPNLMANPAPMQWVLGGSFPQGQKATVCNCRPTFSVDVMKAWNHTSTFQNAFRVRCSIKRIDKIPPSCSALPPKIMETSRVQYSTIQYNTPTPQYS